MDAGGKWPLFSRGLFLIGSAIGCWIIVIGAVLMFL